MLAQSSRKLDAISNSQASSSLLRGPMPRWGAWMPMPSGSKVSLGSLQKSPSSRWLEMDIHVAFRHLFMNSCISFLNIDAMMMTAPYCRDLWEQTHDQNTLNHTSPLNTKRASLQRSS